MNKPRRQTKREINWLQFHGLIKRASQPIKKQGTIDKKPQPIENPEQNKTTA